MPRPSPVICWYWTKAIALLRGPGAHSPLRSLVAIRLWRYPLSRASSATNLVAYVKNRQFEVQSLNADYGEFAVASPAEKDQSAGATLGLKRDALGLSHLTCETTA